jgi:hypothetical protein
MGSLLGVETLEVFTGKRLAHGKVVLALQGRSGTELYEIPSGRSKYGEPNAIGRNMLNLLLFVCQLKHNDLGGCGEHSIPMKTDEMIPSLPVQVAKTADKDDDQRVPSENGIRFQGGALAGDHPRWR